MIHILKSEYLDAIQTWWIQLEILTSVSRFEQALNSFLQFRTGFWRFSDAVLNCVNSASVNLFELYEMTTSLEKEKVPPEISTARILTLSILYFQYFRIYHYLTNPLPLSNCLSVYLSVCGKDNPLFVFHLSNYFRTPVYHFRILQGIDRYREYRDIQSHHFRVLQIIDRYREYRDMKSHHFRVLRVWIDTESIEIYRAIISWYSRVWIDTESKELYRDIISGYSNVQIVFRERKQYIRKTVHQKE